MRLLDLGGAGDWGLSTLALKLAVRPWRMAPLSQLFTSMAVGILLVLVGFMFWLQQSLKPVIARLNHEQIVTAYFDPSTQIKENEIVDSIRTRIGSHAEIKVVDENGFLSQLKNQFPDLSKELEELGGDLKTVVPRYVTVSGVLQDSDVEKIKSMSPTSFESVESSKEKHRHIISAFNVLRWVARVLALGICLALLTGLVQLSRMNSYIHGEALAILRFWGAGEIWLRIPGMISGLIVGALGGFMSALGWLIVGEWLAVHIRSLSPLLRGMPVTSPHIALMLLISGALLGFCAGVAGTMNISAAKTGAQH